MDTLHSAPEAHHDHRPGFVARWLFSTNHKDLGTLRPVDRGAAPLLHRVDLHRPE
jgi:hypothetical protein